MAMDYGNFRVWVLDDGARARCRLCAGLARTRLPISKSEQAKRDVDPAVSLRRRLPYELSAAPDQNQIDFGQIGPKQRCAPRKVSDKRPFLNPGRRLEGVAVEEDVACDRPGLRAYEEIPTPGALQRARIEPAARKCRPDASRPVIRFQVVAESQQGARLAVGIDIPEARAEFGNGIDAQTGTERYAETPFMLAGKYHARLVLELIRPAARPGLTQQGMKAVLHGFSQR